MTPEVKIAIAPDVLSLLNRIHRCLADHGITAYLTGGMVRDMRLGREVEDIDLAVAGDALEVASTLADELGGRYVCLDEENGVGRVVLAAADKKWELDFSTIEDGVEADMARRDFTIDAMAVELAELLRRPESPALIDPLCGEQDLNAGLIRAVSEASFPADPVRLLRAVRLAAELSFVIYDGTKALLRKYIDQVLGYISLGIDIRSHGANHFRGNLPCPLLPILSLLLQIVHCSHSLGQKDIAFNNTLS